MYAVSGSSEAKVQFVTASVKVRLNETPPFSTEITTVEDVEFGFQCSLIHVDFTIVGYSRKPSAIG